MSKSILACFLALCFITCTNTDDCSSSDTDIGTWMQDLMEDCDNHCCTCTLDIYSAKYAGQEVFYYSLTGPLCDVIFQVELLDRCGAIIKKYEPGEFDKFYDEVTEVKLIFDCN